MRHLFNKLRGILFIMMFPLMLSGCGKQFEETNLEITDQAADGKEIVPTDGNLIVVGVSQVGSESVWRSAHSASIQRVFTKEEGYFLIFDNARQKHENQIKAIRSFISQKVDYIVVSPIQEEGWETVLQEAKDAEIPVILMDRKTNVTDTSLFTTWVGSNFVEEGQKAGEWLAGYLAEKKREDDRIDIVVLQGTTGSTSMMGRTAGFQYVAQAHENWYIREEVNAEYTTAKGKEEMAKLIKKYPDIDVVVSQNDDMTFGALEALDEAGITTGVHGDVIVISFDAVKDALVLLQRGLINVDVECNPEQGEYIARIIRKLERGETVERAYYVPEKVFTPENVDDYINNRTY